MQVYTRMYTCPLSTYVLCSYSPSNSCGSPSKYGEVETANWPPWHLRCYRQAWNQTEQTEQTLRSGSARWLACSVRLARWRDPVARARLGSAVRPHRLLGLGPAPPHRAARVLSLWRGCAVG